MWKKIIEGLAALGGAVLSFFCGMPPIIWVLIAVMSLDYVTGLLCGWTEVSDKTPHGGLDSGAAFKGLMKKALILIVVLLAALLDQAVSMGAGAPFDAVTGATCLWFIAGEGISILENAVRMGVRVPAVLTRALELMKTRGENDPSPGNGSEAG